MNGSVLLKKLSKYLSFMILFILLGYQHSISQRLGIASDDYLKAIGFEENHIVMKNILRNALKQRVENRSDKYYEDNATFFSMVLLLSGVRPDHYYRLEENGVDVINAITADIRPFDEQSLLSDLVILGTVVEVKDENFEDDGFDVTVVVSISETFKGTAPRDTIYIRQRSSSRQPGSDNRPMINESYLLLLSSGMYGYHKTNHQFQTKEEIIVSPPDFGNERIFVIYRIYPYRNNQLFRSLQPAGVAFNSLRNVNRILNAQ